MGLRDGNGRCTSVATALRWMALLLPAVACAHPRQGSRPTAPAPDAGGATASAAAPLPSGDLPAEITQPTARDDEPGLTAADRLVAAGRSAPDCTEAMALVRAALEWSHHPRVYVAVGRRGCQCRDVEAVWLARRALRGNAMVAQVQQACGAARFDPPEPPSLPDPPGPPAPSPSPTPAPPPMPEPPGSPPGPGSPRSG
jgi:hypothetical protein